MDDTKYEISTGECLIKENPFIHVIKSDLRSQICDTCLKRNNELLKCSGCGYLYYCDKSCQKLGWPKQHKFECKLLKRISPKVLPESAHMLSRIILKLKYADGNQAKSYYTPNKFRMFKDLMSHYSEIKLDSKRMEHLISLSGVIKSFFQDETKLVFPNISELITIYGRMCINSFSILDEEMSSIGVGLYLACSIIDHSCQPNAVAVFQGPTLMIRSIQPIPKLDWSKIHISYIELLNSREMRQLELKRQYYFDCLCDRCHLDNSKHLETIYSYSAICPNQKCTLRMIQNDDTVVEQQNMNVICNQCNTDVPKQFVNNYFDVIEFTKSYLSTMEQSISYIDVCKLCLKKHENVLHDLNIYHVKILDHAFESSIVLKLWNDAIDYSNRLIPAYKFYYGEIHPMLGLLYLKIGKILVYLNRSNEAIDYLNQAKQMLVISHGATHTLCKQQLEPLIVQATLESSIAQI